MNCFLFLKTVLFSSEEFLWILQSEICLEKQGHFFYRKTLFNLLKYIKALSTTIKILLTAIVLGWGQKSQNYVYGVNRNTYLRFFFSSLTEGANRIKGFSDSLNQCYHQLKLWLLSPVSSISISSIQIQTRPFHIKMLIQLTLTFTT